MTAQGHRWTFARSAAHLACFFLLSQQLSMAQIDRSHAPAPGPPPEVHLGEHTTFVLPNDMRVIVVEDHKLPLVSVQVRFDIRPFREGDLAGYSDLAGELLSAGAGGLSKGEIDARVDAIGATLNTSKYGVYAACLKPHVDELFTLVEKVVISPEFPEEEVAKAHRRMLSGIKQQQEDPDAVADQVGRVLTYGKSHPYGEVVTEETLGKVGRAQVKAYHDHFFDPRQGYLVFVGDITEKEARALSQRAFGTWEAPDPAPRDVEGWEQVEGLGTIRTAQRKPEAVLPRRAVIVDRPGAVQSVIRVVFPVELRPGDPDVPAAQVMNTILGGGVFNARLMQNLREDKGFTYGAYSSLQSDREVGSFVASTSVRSEVTDSALTEIMFELEHLPLLPLKEEELSLAKNFLAGQFLRSLEDPRTKARYVLNTYMYYLAKDHYNTYPERLAAVTAEDVKRVAERLLRPDHAAMLVVGDMSAVGGKLVPLSFDGVLHQYDVWGDVYREELVPAPEEITVDSVVEAYVRARGGRERLTAVKDVHLVMKGDLMGAPVQVDEWYELPDGYAARTMMAGQVLEQVVHHDGRSVRKGMAGTEDLDPSMVEQMTLDATPFPELAMLKHGKFTLAGITTFQGRQAYKVFGELDWGADLIMYFDVASGLLLRRSGSQLDPDRGMVNVTTDLRDWREVAGVLFPFEQETTSGVNWTFAVETVEVDQGVPSTVYRID